LDDNFDDDLYGYPRNINTNNYPNNLYNHRPQGNMYNDFGDDFKNSRLFDDSDDDMWDLR